MCTRISLQHEPSFTVEAVTFTKPLRDVTLSALGLKATFECELSKPGVRVDWFKAGDQPLRRGDKYDIVADDRRHVLTVHDVHADDVSTYKAVYEKLSTEAKLELAGEKIQLDTIMQTCVVASFTCKMLIQ